MTNKTEAMDATEILDRIPFSFVSFETRSKLALKLDPYNHQAKDWRGLADQLDFTGDEIEVLISNERYLNIAMVVQESQSKYLNPQPQNFFCGDISSMSSRYATQPSHGII